MFFSIVDEDEDEDEDVIVGVDKVFIFLFSRFTGALFLVFNSLTGRGEVLSATGATLIFDTTSLVDFLGILFIFTDKIE